jgi:hypothetical protein
MPEEMKCPVPHAAGGPPPSVTATEDASPESGAVTMNSRKIMNNAAWWPDRLDLAILSQNNALVDPLDPSFDYAAAFATLDLDALNADLPALVARRLRPLRPLLHPHGLALRRHLPHLRRPRRRRHGHTAFRPAQ